MKTQPISVCLISGPEAERIGLALASVAGWTAEMVVLLNDDVADGTAQVAERFGARVYREPWKGFVGQKNSVCDKASQPWILGLDADEVVSEALKEEIQRTVSALGSGEEPAAFSFPRCTSYCGRWIRHGDWYPDRVTRLWRKSAARWEGTEPHAYLRVQGSVRRLRGDLHHFSNESIDRQIGKIIPYSDAFVQDARERGRRASMLDLATRPWWRFVRAYVFRLGFLDGWQGYHIAWMGAFHTVTRYAKLRQAQTSPRPQQAAPGSLNP